MHGGIEGIEVILNNNRKPKLRSIASLAKNRVLIRSD
jgi:hypothetical protein